MTLRRLILPLLAAVMLIPAASANAQRRTLRALSTAVQNNRSSLLNQMFSPGGAAFRNASPLVRPHFRQSSRVTIQPTPIYRYSSDGTVYDRFSYDSFPGRFAMTSITPSTFSAGNVSSNSANVYAPAAYHVPGTPTAAEPAPGTLVMGGFTSAAGMTQTDFGGGLVPPPAISEALLQIRKQRSEGIPRAATVDSALFANTTGSGSAAFMAGRDHAGTSSARPRGDSVSAPAPPEAATQQINIALRNGAKAFQRGDYTDARDAYIHAMIMGCNDTRARLGLALADFALGNFREASQAIRAELLHAPHLDRTALDLRKAYGRPEDFDAQLDALRQAAATTEDVNILLLLGYMRYYSGDRSGGRAAFLDCLADPALDQDLADILRQLSN